jgi:hypothetical protein
MEFVLVFAQAAAAGLCFLMPGLAALRRLTRGTCAGWPAAYALAAAFLISSVLVAGLTAAATALLPPSLAAIVSLAVAGGSMAFAATEGRRMFRAMAGAASAWETRMWWLLLAALAAWLALMPLSPYPSLLTVVLGDTPGYYRVAANLAAGRGWLADFFIGDYVGGRPPYLTDHPLPVLVITFLFHLAGPNGRSLEVYSALAGALHVALFSTFVCRASDGGMRGRLLPALAMAAMAVPAYFHLLGLGVFTVPGALAFLAVVALLVDPPETGPRRLAAPAAGVMFLLLARPESALLGALLLAVWPLEALLMSGRFRAVTRLAVAAALAAAVVAAWANLPALVGALPPALKNLSVFYLRYDEAGRQFVWMHSPWWEINRMLCAANFAPGAHPLPECNAAIGEQIRAHPAAFLGFAGREGWGMITRLTAAFSIHTYLRPSPAIRALVVFMLVFTCLGRRNWKPMAVTLAFYAAMPLVNAGSGGRHLLPAVSATYALFGRAVMARPGWALRRLAAVGGLVVLLGNALDVAAIRADPFNRSYVELLGDLRRVMRPGDLVASSYPQLISSETGHPAVGCTWLADNIGAVVARCAPDIVVIDDARDGPENYTLMRRRGGLAIPGYRLARDNPPERYAIFVAAPRRSGKSAGAADAGRGGAP